MERFDVVVGVITQCSGDRPVVYDVVTARNTHMDHDLADCGKIVATLNEKQAAKNFANDLVNALIRGGHSAVRGRNFTCYLD